jgi:hypothetical protein
MCPIGIINLINATRDAGKDASNFAYVEKIAAKFWPLITQSMQSITDNDNKILNFNGKINKIYNFKMFSSFIEEENGLIYGIKDLIQQFGMQMNSLKDYMTNLQAFSTVNPNKTFIAIQPFVQTAFAINYLTIYSLTEDLLKKATKVLSGLNF